MNPDIYDWAGRSLSDLVKYYEAWVPSLFPDRFPANFELAPSDWHLKSEVVHRSQNNVTSHGTRPIGTLDVEFLADSFVTAAKVGQIDLGRNYPCGLKCPGCFSEDPTYHDAGRFLSWREVFAVIDDAREIGLTSLKFLGPGELFQNPDLFDILGAAEKRRLPLSIFTKGAELGDDELASQTFAKQGIHKASELVERVCRYSCVRILLGFNSFDPVLQDRMVGGNASRGSYQINANVFVNRGVEKYTEKRNAALKNLIENGLNDPAKGQRLSLIAAPIGLNQIDEVTEMYVWAARRNLPLVIAPTMESGPKAVGLMKYNQKRDPRHDKLKQMYISVYSKAIETGITDISRLEREDISAYMGTAPCNQVANGLYLRLNGTVQMCPGGSGPEMSFGNVHEKSIRDIWRESINYRLGAQDNNWCVAKVNGMPRWLRNEVAAFLSNKYRNVATGAD